MWLDGKEEQMGQIGLCCGLTGLTAQLFCGPACREKRPVIHLKTEERSVRALGKIFKVDLKGIVTDVFSLDEAQKAMDYSVNNKADIVKAVIRIDE